MREEVAGEAFLGFGALWEVAGAALCAESLFLFGFPRESPMGHHVLVQAM